MTPLMHPLLQLLVTERVITERDGERIAHEWKEKGGLLDEYLFGVGVTDEVVATMRGKLFHLPSEDVSGRKIPKDILHLIPEDVVRHYRIVALRKEGNRLSVGLVDPENLKTREAVEFLVQQKGMTVEFIVISERALREIVKQYQELGKEAEEVLDLAEEKFQKGKPEQKEEVLKSAPVSQMVSSIIRHAVEEHASDIHIEPFGKQTRVRYRIDGILHTSLSLPQYIHAAIVSRIKVLANLKLDETRLPQDGRIKMNLDGRDVDLRVSTLPLMDYEKVVIRILDTSGALPTLEDLGFRPATIATVRQHITKPNGLILMTGPTGSGKTTTLYAMLALLNRDGVNIVTLEDPVEYFISGINQSQVNSEVGLTFAAGLRSILRQDPNVIMVGEIRDQETGELAVHAGLTGHLVFSTLHTKDAFGAIPRLIDMGLEPFLIASTLSLVMAQRLVRKVCSFCKEAIVLPHDLAKEIEGDILRIPRELFSKGYAETLTFYRGKGCPRCGNGGYQGRTTVLELIEVTDAMQKIMTSSNRPEDVRAELERQKFISMRQDGILKALEGMTTIEEVLRVTRE